MLAIIFFVGSLLAAAQGHNSSTAVSSNMGQNIMNEIDKVLMEGNEYITELLELVIKLVSAFSNFISNINSGNSTHINIADLTTSIKNAFNSSSANCSSQEDAEVQDLIANTTLAIQSCYKDVSEEIQELIPEIEELLENLMAEIKNVSDGVNNCFKHNPMMFGLPGCLMGELNYAKDKYVMFVQQINKTISEVKVTVNHMVFDTKNCMSNVVTDFFPGYGQILLSFVECIAT